MIQRVLMKPFLDHLNCNTDKLERVTKQQWAMSSKGQTDIYWFSLIIYLILLSKRADGHSSPSRPICPSSSLWCLLHLSIQKHTCIDADVYSRLARNSLGIFLSPLWWCHSERPCVCCVPILLYSLHLWRKQGVCRWVFAIEKSDTTHKQQSINWC